MPEALTKNVRRNAFEPGPLGLDALLKELAQGFLDYPGNVTAQHAAPLKPDTDTLKTR